MDAFYLIFKLICQLSFSYLSHLFAVAFLLLALATGTYFVAFTPLGRIEASSHGVSGSDQSVIDFLHEEHGTPATHPQIVALPLLSYLGPVVCVAPGWYSIGDPEAAAALLNAFTPKVVHLTRSVISGTNKSSGSAPQVVLRDTHSPVRLAVEAAHLI